MKLCANKPSYGFHPRNYGLHYFCVHANLMEWGTHGILLVIEGN